MNYDLWLRDLMESRKINKPAGNAKSPKKFAHNTDNERQKTMKNNDIMTESQFEEVKEAVQEFFPEDLTRQCEDKLDFASCDWSRAADLIRAISEFDVFDDENTPEGLTVEDCEEAAEVMMQHCEGLVEKDIKKIFSKLTLKQLKNWSGADSATGSYGVALDGITYDKFKKLIKESRKGGSK